MIDRWSRRALVYLASALLATGTPLALGASTFDKSYGGQLSGPANDWSAFLPTLLFGGLIGVVTFVPLFLLASKITGAVRLSSALVIGLTIQLFLFLIASIIWPGAPILSGNASLQLTGGIFGAGIASILLMNEKIGSKGQDTHAS